MHVDNFMDFFDIEYEDNSDIESICLKCGEKESIPDFIYDECSKKVYHEELKQQIYTLNCNHCNKLKVIPIDYYIKNNKNNFINNMLKELSDKDIRYVFSNLLEMIPYDSYEKVTFIVKDKLGKLEYNKDLMDKEFNKIKNKFDLVNSGKIYFECIIYETGYEGSFGKSYESTCTNTTEISNVLNEAFDYMKQFIYYKKYDKAIKLCDLILYSHYKGRKIYVDDDFESDSYVDIKLYRIDDLPINIKDVYLSKAYCLIMLSSDNNQIFECVNEGRVSIEDAFDMGIIKIDKESFMKKWDEYIKTRFNKKKKHK